MGSGLNRLRAIVSLFTLLVLAGVAAGQPPLGADPNSPLGLWFRSLTQPYSGRSCCSIADCRPVEARLAGDGWEIRVGGRWLAVSQLAVLKRDNPNGRPSPVSTQTTSFASSRPQQRRMPGPIPRKRRRIMVKSGFHRKKPHIDAVGGDTLGVLGQLERSWVSPVGVCHLLPATLAPEPPPPLASAYSRKAPL